MSITNGFEDKRAWSDVGHVYSEIYVDDLLAHARALEAMLKKHEFANYDSEWGDSRCPECGGSKESMGNPEESIGHAPDCQLAKLLEGVEEQPGEKE